MGLILDVDVGMDGIEVVPDITANGPLPEDVPDEFRTSKRDTAVQLVDFDVRKLTSGLKDEGLQIDPILLASLKD